MWYVDYLRSNLKLYQVECLYWLFVIWVCYIQNYTRKMWTTYTSEWYERKKNEMLNANILKWLGKFDTVTILWSRSRSQLFSCPSVAIKRVYISGDPLTRCVLATHRDQDRSWEPGLGVGLVLNLRLCDVTALQANKSDKNYPIKKPPLIF